MNIRFSLVIVALFAITFGFSSCEDDDNTVAPISTTSKTFTANATGYTNWVYFSFSKNDTVQISDPANSLEWDIAFQRNRIKTNSGVNGKGAAGSYKTDKNGITGWGDLYEVPAAATYIVDTNVQVQGQGGSYLTYPMNDPLYNALVYVQASNTLNPSNDIFVLKTAAGKYVKFWLKAYYNAEAKSGYPSFQYHYQPDGTTKF